MKKIMLTIFICTYIIFIPKIGNTRSYINISGFNDYPPFGYTYQNGKNIEWRSVFQPIVESMLIEIKKEVDYQTYSQITDKAISEAILTGDIDLFFGAYNQNNRFDKLVMFYPSIISNPITFFVLPAKMSTIKNVEELQKLKGVRYSGEIFTDFIEEKLKNWNIEKVDTIYELFEKLFTKQADYILSSYYFGFIEAVKLGVSHQIAFSKTPIWNIPVFVGVSAKSPFGGTINYHIKRYFEDPKIISAVKTRLQEIINEFELEYSGVVPPAFNIGDKPANQDDDKKEDM